MKKYFNVTFEYNDSVWCVNIAHAESAEAVEAHYRKKYSGYLDIRECTEYDIEAARLKGMPFIEVEKPREEARAEMPSIYEKMTAELEARKDRSAWNKGVDDFMCYAETEAQQAMTVTELTAEQIEELKQQYLCNSLMETEGRSPSYDELANAAELVPDCLIFEAYLGTVFSEDDFMCSAETEAQSNDIRCSPAPLPLCPAG